MRGKKGDYHGSSDDPPRPRANKQRGHGTYDNDRPPIVGTVGRESGQVRLRLVHHTDQKTLGSFGSQGVDKKKRSNPAKSSQRR